MGFIQAFVGGLSQTFANQWLDYYQPMQGVPESAAIIPAVAIGQDKGVGANTKGSSHVISNGSKILVPDGYAFVTVEDGTVTGCITQPGGYTFESNNPASKTFFHSGDGFFSATLGQTWEKFKSGGIANTSQLGFYVPKYINGLRFGTAGTIHWMDAYFAAQVGCLARGTYRLEVVDPILWTQFIPVKYKGEDNIILDLNDMDDDNSTGAAIFKEIQTSLEQGFSRFANIKNADGSVRKITDIQSNTIELGRTIGGVLEEGYHWLSEKGVQIGNVALTVEYDEETTKLLSDIRAADSMSVGNRANAFMAYGAAKGMQQGGAGAAMMGMMNMNAMQGFQQQPNPQPGMGPDAYGTAAPAQAAAPSPTDKLLEMKKLLDAGAISQEEYDKVKNEVLGS